MTTPAILPASRVVFTPKTLLFAALGALFLLALLLEILLGPVAIAPGRLLHLLLGAPADATESAVLWQIRLPRALMAVAVGAALGMSGAAQQGLFRNQLADPALIGVSAGAALAAVTGIVLFAPLQAVLPIPPSLLIPVLAFGGGLAATFVALRLAGTDTAGLLLAGIAVNAACGAATGLLITLSDDRQLRDITFWTMGSLAAGGWAGGGIALLACLIAAVMILPTAPALDALLLGEREAGWLGVRVDRLRLRVVVATALAVGAAVAAAGIIGFVGLVVPHLLRLLGSPRHGLVLPGSALLGAALLLLADTLARGIASPAELPVGLVTSALGAPFFIVLLWRGRLA